MKNALGIVLELAKEISSLESQLEGIQEAIDKKKAELSNLLGEGLLEVGNSKKATLASTPRATSVLGPVIEGKRKRLWETNERVLQALKSGPKMLPELLEAAGLRRAGASYKKMARTIRSLTAKNQIIQVERFETRRDGRRYSRKAWALRNEDVEGAQPKTRVTRMTSDEKESRRIAILEALFQPKRPLTIKEVRAMVGGGTGLIHAIVADLIHDELIEKKSYVLPNSHRPGHGWVTTHKGAAVIEQATSPSRTSN